MLVLASSEHEIVGAQRFGRARARGFGLGAADVRDECCDDPRGQLGLHGEDVLEAAVVALRPAVRAGLGLDQLGGDAQPVADPARAAFDHVAGPELGADGAHVARVVVVGEGRVAGDDGDLVVAGFDGAPVDATRQTAGVDEKAELYVRRFQDRRIELDPVRVDVVIACVALQRRSDA